MEEELIAQRDAAIAVTRELQKQLQHQREVAERMFERRALTAERLRLHAEAELRRVNEARDWERRACGRLMYLSLLFGVIGTILGWVAGLLVFMLVAEPFVGFLLVLPGMAVGGLFGLALAKTKLQLEERRRDAQMKQQAVHSEVEMAVSSAVDDADEPLDPLVLPNGEVASSPVRSTNDGSADSSNGDASASASGSRSWAVTGFNLAWRTAQTSVSIASGLLRGPEYVKGMLQSEAPSDPSTTWRSAQEKKQQ